MRLTNRLRRVFSRKLKHLWMSPCELPTELPIRHSSADLLPDDQTREAHINSTRAGISRISRLHACNAAASVFYREDQSEIRVPRLHLLLVSLSFALTAMDCICRRIRNWVRSFASVVCRSSPLHFRYRGSARATLAVCGTLQFRAFLAIFCVQHRMATDLALLPSTGAVYIL